MFIRSVIILSFAFVACQPPKGTKEMELQTMEIFTINGKEDTVNRIDADGRKQGKWIPSPMNNLKDTVYYINDSLIKKRE